MGRALIVSAGTSSNEYLAQHTAECGYPRPTIVPSCGEAKRLLNGGEYDLVVINAPLPDEFGWEFAQYVTETTRAGALLICKQAAAEQVNARLQKTGTLVLSKPFTAGAYHQSLSLAAATARRLERLWTENQALQEKLEQVRLIGRAKCLLVEVRGLKEAEAHRYIEKSAMDSRRSRAEVARALIEELLAESGGG